VVERNRGRGWDLERMISSVRKKKNLAEQAGNEKNTVTKYPLYTS
jgi:hypothetical protein